MKRTNPPPADAAHPAGVLAAGGDASHRATLIFRLTTLCALSAAAGGARRGAATVASPAPDLLVTVRTGTVSAPDSVAAGWLRLRVEEDGNGHILVVFRLPESAIDSDVPGFLAALDTARATPPPALALGGPEIGDTGEVVIQFTRGRYLLGCVTRGGDGHRHASTGEARTIRVTEGASAAPRATVEVPMTEFAYVVPERWTAGSHMLRVENRGRQDHQLRLARLRAGSTVTAWMNAEKPNEHAVPVAGVARMGPGTVAYLPVELIPGRYILFCLVPDPATGRPHVTMGMLRSIQID
ncbi:MAG TPA: hypothetical protein VIQ98_02975 [Gemmatimonadales bacterium]